MIIPTAILSNSSHFGSRFQATVTFTVPVLRGCRASRRSHLRTAAALQLRRLAIVIFELNEDWRFAPDVVEAGAPGLRPIRSEPLQVCPLRHAMECASTGSVVLAHVATSGVERSLDGEDATSTATATTSTAGALRFKRVQRFWERQPDEVSLSQRLSTATLPSVPEFPFTAGGESRGVATPADVQPVLCEISHEDRCASEAKLTRSCSTAQALQLHQDRERGGDGHDGNQARDQDGTRVVHKTFCSRCGRHVRPGPGTGLAPIAPFVEASPQVPSRQARSEGQATEDEDEAHTDDCYDPQVDSKYEGAEEEFKCACPASDAKEEADVADAVDITSEPKGGQGQRPIFYPSAALYPSRAPRTFSPPKPSSKWRRLGTAATDGGQTKSATITWH